jgi:hypothetical protein
MNPSSIVQNKFYPISSGAWMNAFDVSVGPECSLENEGGTLLFTRTNEDYHSDQGGSSYLNVMPDYVLPPQYLMIMPTGTYFKRNIGQISGAPSFITINKTAKSGVSGAIALDSLGSALEGLRTDISRFAATLIAQYDVRVTEAANSFINNHGLNAKMNNIVEIICSNYSTLKGVTLDAKSDPEIIERERLHLTLTISGEPSVVLKEEQRCKKLLYEKEGANTFELLNIRYRWS